MFVRNPPWEGRGVALTVCAGIARPLIAHDAAIRIVRLAAPFAPFPDELRRTTDVLEIIRTWQFRKNSSLRTDNAP